MQKSLTLTLNLEEFDYLQEALDWHSNDGSTKLADKIGQKLVVAWNTGSEITLQKPSKRRLRKNKLGPNAAR